MYYKSGTDELAADVSFSLTRWQHSTSLRERTSWPPSSFQQDIWENDIKDH